MDTTPRNQTTRQVAEFLGISTRHVLRLAHKGQLPHLRLAARTFRFSISEIVNYLNASGKWIDVKQEPLEEPEKPLQGAPTPTVLCSKD